jgi:uncharacterized protein
MAKREFAGRSTQLALLTADLQEVRSSRHGKFALIRGRRQVGKSRLIEEFVERAHSPAIFFSATKGRDPNQELVEFQDLIRRSGIDPGNSLDGTRFQSWDSALSTIARLATEPTIVVIDEFPYLAAGDIAIEGAFQKAWDRSISGSLVLLIVVGSDLAMMEALTEYGRPLYGRPSREIHLQPLDPAESAALIRLDPVDAFDAYLITGGFPNLVNRWNPGQTVRQFLTDQLATSTELLTVSGERMLTAEFPIDSHARTVLSTIGSGVPTFTAIATQSGLSASALDRALKMLVAKRAVTVEQPISAATKSSETRYRIADTYLAFWLRFIERSIPQLDRGRSEHVLDDIMRQWPDYRGRAIEPIVRGSIERLVPLDKANAHTVGSYWTRSGNTEVDVVGVDGTGSRRRVAFVGSIKWRQQRPFDGRDASSLAAQLSLVPGTDDMTVLVAVSASGFDVRDIPIRLGPADLLNAWASSI